jgi:hypothetical protein
MALSSDCESITSSTSYASVWAVDDRSLLNFNGFNDTQCNGTSLGTFPFISTICTGNDSMTLFAKDLYSNQLLFGSK